MNGPGLLLLTLVGLFISGYLAYKKQRRERVRCFLGKNCQRVLESGFARTLGMENSFWGIVYFGGMLVAGLAGIQMAWILPIALFAALFGFYLFLVQALLLRQFCDYCMGAIFISWLMLGVIVY